MFSCRYSTRTKADIELEQRENVAYQKSRRGIRQLFTSNFTSNVPLASAAFQLAAPGSKSGRKFQAKTSPDPASDLLQAFSQPFPVTPTVRMPSIRAGPWILRKKHLDCPRFPSLSSIS